MLFCCIKGVKSSRFLSSCYCPIYCPIYCPKPFLRQKVQSKRARKNAFQRVFKDPSKGVCSASFSQSHENGLKPLFFGRFRRFLARKKRLLAALSIIGYNLVIPTGIPNYSKIMANSRRLYFSFFRRFCVTRTNSAFLLCAFCIFCFYPLSYLMMGVIPYWCKLPGCLRPRRVCRGISRFPPSARR